MLLRARGERHGRACTNPTVAQRCSHVLSGGAGRPQVSKSNAQTLTNAALDGLKAASSEIRAKIEVLKPLQERLSSKITTEIGLLLEKMEELIN